MLRTRGSGESVAGQDSVVPVAHLQQLADDSSDSPAGDGEGGDFLTSLE